MKAKLRCLRTISGLNNKTLILIKSNFSLLLEGSIIRPHYYNLSLFKIALIYHIKKQDKLKWVNSLSTKKGDIFHLFSSVLADMKLCLELDLDYLLLKA